MPSVPPNTPWSERELEGVSLAVYALVHAGLAEGFTLDELLAAQGVVAARWALADEAWTDALLDTDDEAAEVAHDACALIAQDSFARPLPPIDREVGPWLDFLRAFGAEEEPVTWLGSRGLRSSDVLRLHRAWSKRFADEPALREQALALLSEPAGPTPHVTPGPHQPLLPRLAPPALPAAAPRDAEMLDADDDDDDAPAPAVMPPLFAPMPGEDAPPVTAPPITAPPVTAPPEPAAPFLPPALPRPPLPTPTPSAALPLALPATPSLGSTVMSVPSPLRAPLPFAAAAKATSPPGNPGAADPLNTTVAFSVAQGLPAGPAMPFRSGAVRTAPPAADTGATAAPQASPLRSALPFRAEAAAAPAAPPPPPSDVGATAPSAPSPLRPPTPFASPPARALPTLSLDAYAQLCAELFESKEPAEQVFARHGLASQAHRVGVDLAWRERLRVDPELYRVYQARYAHHRAAITAKRTPPT